MLESVERIVGGAGATGLNVGQNIGVGIVNYNTAALTVRAVQSVLGATPPPGRILVLDNGSAETDLQALRMKLGPLAGVELLCERENTGFAGGANRLIGTFLEDPLIEGVLLLNSDAVLEAHALQLLACAIRRTGGAAPPVSAAFGQIMCEQTSGEAAAALESAGLVLYRSLHAANRTDLADPTIGGSGCCVLYSAPFLRELKQHFGEFFPEAFFCYVEDVDVALGALAMGYSPAYVDAVIARHRGKASSGGESSPLAAYLGFRNAIAAVLRNVPAMLVIRCLPYWFLIHIGAAAGLARRSGVFPVMKAYGETLRAFPGFIVHRRRAQALARERGIDLAQYLSKRPHDVAHGHEVIDQLVPHWLRVAAHRVWAKQCGEGGDLDPR